MESKEQVELLRIARDNFCDVYPNRAALVSSFPNSVLWREATVLLFSCISKVSLCSSLQNSIIPAPGGP